MEKNNEYFILNLWKPKDLINLIRFTSINKSNLSSGMREQNKVLKFTYFKAGKFSIWDSKNQNEL